MLSLKRRNKVKQFKFSNLLSFQTPFFYMAILVLAITVFIISSAATASEDIQSIQQVASSKVRGCKFVGDIQGFAGWGETAIKDKATRQALRQAADLNATHVIWTQLPRKYGSHYAYGEAYNCDSTENLAHQKSFFHKIDG
jgi:hypothetical protein